MLLRLLVLSPPPTISPSSKHSWPTASVLLLSALLAQPTLAELFLSFLLPQVTLPGMLLSFLLLVTMPAMLLTLLSNSLKGGVQKTGACIP